MPPRKNVYKVYKLDSEMFYFDGEKEKTIDKVNFCNKCQLERINNPVLKRFCEVNKTIINSIRIYITDALGKIINLNKVDSSFTFILKDNKNI